MTYKVILEGQVIVETDWSPMAQAAWQRASRDRDAAVRGGVAELWKDERMLLRVTPQTLHGHPWPGDDECDQRDVFKALLQLFRDDGWDAKELAMAMTHYGLPTSRSRIDALKGTAQGKRAEVSSAELVVLITAVLNQYKSGDNGPVAQRAPP